MISELMVSDMKQKMDQSQYGNNKGISVQHYLVKMLHKILTQLDNNSGGDTFAVIVALIDWKQAFPRQCPKLGVQAFIAVGI